MWETPQSSRAELHALLEPEEPLVDLIEIRRRFYRKGVDQPRIGFMKHLQVASKGCHQPLLGFITGKTKH